MLGGQWARANNDKFGQTSKLCFDVAAEPFNFNISNEKRMKKA